jgi:enterochelin esterase-like enzyme
MRFTTALFISLAMALPARAQYLGCVNLDRVNRRLAGQVVDYTKNHGTDHRIFSPILGMPRDLYVYLPQGYDPSRAYPLVLYFHMALVDEHYFVGSSLVSSLDELIGCGRFPPAVVACPDGTYSCRDRFRDVHSFYVNGLGGRFEDHIFQEVIPFLAANYSIRPEQQAHALLGTSPGGYGR